MKITITQYVKFLQSLEAHREERTGQHFCNYFNITDQELFYETDRKKAHEKINQYLG